MFTRKNIFIHLFVLIYYSVGFSQGFVTTWTTTSNNETINIPMVSTGTGYNVDWGDSETSEDVTSNATSGPATFASHTYVTAGTYTITITDGTSGGSYSRIVFNNTGDKDKIMSIESWGTNTWTSMANAFFGCSNLVNNATDTPNLTGLTSVGLMFRNATSIGGGTSTNWDSWNMSNVTSMVQMFRGATAFNEDISSWNVSLVSNMNNLFNGATAFNQNIGNWMTSSVTTMITTFRNATSFDPIQAISSNAIRTLPFSDSFPRNQKI